MSGETRVSLVVRAPDIVAGFRDLLQVHLCRWSYDFENFLIFSTALIQFRSSIQHLEFTLLILTLKQARNNPVSGFWVRFIFLGEAGSVLSRLAKCHRSRMPRPNACITGLLFVRLHEPVGPCPFVNCRLIRRRAESNMCLNSDTPRNTRLGRHPKAPNQTLIKKNGIHPPESRHATRSREVPRSA